MSKRSSGKEQNKWKNKISHTAQFGGIETSILDNGPGRGTRIAWINTGSGLRYKVVIDRAMDIADAFYNRYGLAWLSHTGITSPQPLINRGTDWLRSFGGGLLTTCGLSHMGGPESDEFGERGLHGLISNLSAELERIEQPDPAAGKMDMSITGRMREVKVMGVQLELRRTISGTLGESYINIVDEVTNIGNQPAPHMLLYHYNFGWPLVDEGSKILLKGKPHLLDEKRDGTIYNNKYDFRNCPAPMEAHRGIGEVAAYFDMPADHRGECTTGIYNPSTGIAVLLIFKKQELPWLTNWQHWGPGEYVTGLEPGTNPPVGQAHARKKNQLLFLAPGETKVYDVRLEVKDNEKAVNAKFL